MDKEKRYIVEEINKTLFLVYAQDYGFCSDNDCLPILKEGIKEIAEVYTIVNMVPHIEPRLEGYMGGSRTVGYYVFIKQ